MKNSSLQYPYIVRTGQICNCKDELKGYYQLSLGDRITGDVHFLLQNFVCRLNFFTMSKYHAHNQKTKIKLHIIVFMFGGKKGLVFCYRERIFVDRDT